MNSTVTIAELAAFLTRPTDDVIPMAIVIDLLTVLAMFVRNLSRIGELKLKPHFGRQDRIQPAR